MMYIVRVLAASLVGLLLATATNAADLTPTKAPPQNVQQYIPFVPDWTGFYIVAEAGGMWGSIGACCVNGGTEGGGLGYNWQTGRLVYGLEADGDWFNMSSVGPRYRDDASLRGRVGYTFDRLLLYVTGGLTVANILPVAITPTTAYAWDSGYTAGAGIEYWATPELSTRLEYRYSGYDKNVSFPFNQTENFTVRGGLMWHFGMK
jgi:outer membrane immunogenic protein